MHFQYVVAPPSLGLPVPPAPPPVDGPAELLRELIGVQKEQLAYLRAAHEAQHNVGRWQAFLARWADDFPTVGDGCRQSLPQIERAFVKLLDDLTRRIGDEDADDLENEFALSEFLDRYGMRLAQLGNVLNVLGPIAEAAKASDPPPE
jgi:hypothetical protein